MDNPFASKRTSCSGPGPTISGINKSLAIKWRTTLTKILQQRISRITASLASAGLLMMFATQPAPAQTLKALYSFTGAADGGDPFPAVIRDAAGNLYGTTDYAGSAFAGVVFKVSKTGQETVLYNFCLYSSCTGRKHPFKPLARQE